jgi:type IV pilus assembly protein PilN
MSNINLLPWRQDRIYYKNNIFYLSAISWMLVFFILLFSCNLYFKFINSNNSKDIDYLNSQIQIYESKSQEISGLKERKKILLNRLEVINALQSRRFSVVNILDKLTSAVPSGVVLTAITAKEDSLIISGVADSNSRVSFFMLNLENCKIFVNPNLQEIKSSKASDNKEDPSKSVSFSLELSTVG